MSEKRFIVGETLRDYYQIKCEKKDYSRVLAPNTVARLLNEQQDTIFKLQDICGKSDGENMKLRIENKRLQKELNDCEKFRYTTFKRMRDVLDE